MRKPALKTAVPSPDIKLNLGCGYDLKDGFRNVDLIAAKGVVRVDLRLAWPWGAESVSAIESKDLLPCLTMPERLFFLDEAWRVLKTGGQMTIMAPGRGSNRAYTDPTYQWPEVVEDFFYYASKEWRERTRYAGTPIKANFHWSYGFVLDDEIVPRNEEAQRHAVKFFRNAAHSLIITLTKLA